jgi:hypothetical protein
VTFTVPPPDVNSTIAVVAADIFSKQLTLLLAKHVGAVPDHPKKPDPGPGADVNVTSVPAGKFCVHVPLVVAPVNVQLIPMGALVIVPPPVCGVPATTVSGNIPGPGVNVAVTVSVAVIVNWQVFPVPVQAVGAPTKAPVPGVVAVSVTCVPLGYCVVQFPDGFAPPCCVQLICPRLSVTVPNAVPAVFTCSVMGAAAVTVIVPVAPVIVAVTVSVAAIVCAPAVFNVAENVPTPFVSVEFAGSIACVSLLVKWTVPVYPVTTAFEASSAVTVTLNAVPDVAVPGAVTEKCVAVPDPIVVVTLAELFPIFGSVELPATVAVFVKLPATVGVTW